MLRKVTNLFPLEIILMNYYASIYIHWSPKYSVILEHDSSKQSKILIIIQDILYLQTVTWHSVLIINSTWHD